MSHVYERPGLDQAFIPVSIKTLYPSQIVGAALYVREAQDTFRLYRSQDIPLGEDDLLHLYERGVSTLYMDARDHAMYQQYLRENLDAILTDESISPAKRFASLNDVVRDVLAESFSSNDAGATVDQCWLIARQSVELICREDIVATDLLGMMYHDYHTFTHSANVSYYCVLLAEGMGIQDRDVLRQISVGALLHDYGKLSIPDRFLTKPGRLTDEERETVRDHPRIGLMKLRSRQDLSYAQLMMVYQHHEQVDGRGYPVGIRGSGIHDWAKLCAVVDIFEALTSNRPYRNAMSRKSALELMGQMAGTRLDVEMLKSWRALIA